MLVLLTTIYGTPMIYIFRTLSFPLYRHQSTRSDMYRAYRVPKQGAAILPRAASPRLFLTSTFLRFYGYCILRVDLSGTARRVIRASADKPPRTRG